MSANLLRKGLIENPQQCLDLRILSSNPIGVINRRNGFDQPAQPLRSRGLNYNEDTELSLRGLKRFEVFLVECPDADNFSFGFGASIGSVSRIFHFVLWGRTEIDWLDSG
ncbi:MAG TPA: hypothetical protein VN414_06450 [Methanosarcina sp.]|nr:hypothetical protein [Methanosarcina sp.]